MDYVELYYELAHGIYPFEDDEPKIKTQKVIDYLIEAKISERDIIRIIEEAPKADYLTHKDLPDWLWENSLLKRDTFYYHQALQIRSRAPKMNMVTLEVETVPFYLEMQIKFSANDALLYIYNKTNMEFMLKDEKRDLGAIAHLLSQYSRLDFMEPIDFLLSMVDYAVSEEDCSLMNIFQIDAKYRAQVFEYLSQRSAQAKASKADTIIYR